MNSVIYIKVFTMREVFPTFFTFIRIFASMNSKMSKKMGNDIEELLHIPYIERDSHQYGFSVEF